MTGKGPGKLHQEDEVVWGTTLLDLSKAGRGSTESVQDSYGSILVAWWVDTCVSEDHTAYIFGIKN
jgi:hypothetical protein